MRFHIFEIFLDEGTALADAVCGTQRVGRGAERIVEQLCNARLRDVHACIGGSVVDVDLAVVISDGTVREHDIGNIADALFAQRGDEEAAIEAMHQHSRFTYGGRFEGTLYQQKNKMIVLNTLLRKAIEPSKVHPYYIDAISSKYSRIIEEANEVPNEMMWQMTRDYCAYVRRYSLKEYSPAVQKVMNYVNLNVAEPLTLKSLAAMCFISPSYLSALFKQETGSTLIDYINTQRVNRAAQLLVQNNHTIAAVAEEVGILDVNYFTKIFKKTLGVTPTRYRREHKEK